MSKQELIDAINKMSPAQLQVVEDLVEKIKCQDEVDAHKKSVGRGSSAGILKGKVWMSDDFDEPLEDFKDYM